MSNTNPNNDSGTDPNTLVTSAVFKAERALDDAISAYEALLASEGACLMSARDEMLVEVATRGSERALVILTVLRALRGRK